MQQFKRLVPLMNRVLIKKLEVPTKTQSGILLNSGDTKNPAGVVIEAGEGYYDHKGEFVKICVKVGDTVLLPDFGGQKVKVSGQELLIFRDTDLLGILSR
ncbi:unnamed protein product (macronuclear) [Paramecium tetraurelia]|uniref:10 kDa chaperonin n=1 Tax=Paramecium tetraurelia TaxID=5888 RepID=A0DTY4_PARTE|nr:uncharacterized protein GSPATT00020185001 [Paramecium tetraurelia]CAK86501.1 unnamed protein product [Paramecium tetraurelia]|eukprot:XP_001453898.1 hypothetical protein (macronuclear) [Paramecium tetraurelia strain d4-2]